MMGLLDRGIGIWPTQLPRYAEVVKLADDEYEDFWVPAKSFDDPVPKACGVWQELVHPLGGTYYYNNQKNAYTSMNLRNYQDLQRLDDFVDASRAAAKEDKWVLVVYPTMFMGEERFRYYYVIPGRQIIAWLEDLNGYILFQDCIQPNQWRHKRLELEAQYWKHFEFFPHNFRLHTSQIVCIRRELGCYLGEATTLSQSTPASMFWTMDQMNQVVLQLASIENLADNGIIEETGVVFCCRILYILRHYQYMHRHNQPEARLIRTHEVRERRRKNRAFSLTGNVAAAMLCMKITTERIRNTSIDGIIDGVEVRRFIDHLSRQSRNQITWAGASIAMDIAIFAIPGLGTSVTAQTLCSCSLLFGVGCIFAGTMVQHFGERMKFLDFAGYYLRKKRMMLIVITSIPTFFCVLSVMGSILGFIAGVVMHFKASAPFMIASFVMLGIIVGLLLVLAVASYGPGPARIRPQ